MNSATLQRLAARWIFPGLVAAMVIGNQNWTLGPVAAGQALSWLNDAAAVVIVLVRFRGRLWPLALIGTTVLAKLISILPPFAVAGDLAFDVGLGLLFCTAGAVIVSERPGIVYRQAVIMAAISIPLMVLQITGAASWSYALNRESTEDTPEIQRTLFVPESDLHYRTSQARPTGFTHSNNFVSLLAVFALALHFSCIRTSRLTRRDLIVCTFAILTMAKIVMLVYVVICAWKFVTGSSLERHRMVRVALLTVAIVAAYGVLFPGLLAANTSYYKLSYSFFIRVNNFAELLPADSAFRAWLAGRLAGTPRTEWAAGATLSGYSQLIGVLPYLVVATILLLPVFYAGVGRVRERYPAAVDMMVLTLFVVVLYPTAVPLFRAQIFAFVAGFAFLPLFVIFETGRFPGPIGVFFSRAPARAEGGR